MQSLRSELRSLWKRLNGWEPVLIHEEKEGQDEITWVLHLHSRLYTKITDKADGSYHRYQDHQDSLDPSTLARLNAEGKEGWHRTT